MIYLDNNASTRPAPEVIDAMMPFFREHYGNPSSSNHDFGLYLQRVIEKCREEIAAHFNAPAHALTLTSGATESLNTVLKGVVEAFYPRKTRLVISQIEHPAVLRIAGYLAGKGIPVSKIGVDSRGFLKLDELKRALTHETALVSIIAANNEIGTLQNIEAIYGICSERDVPLHLDYTQAFGHIPINLQALPVDLISFGVHKIHGPIGIGGILRNSLKNFPSPVPLIHGGGQENDMRGGTLNTPLIVGMAKAIALLNAGTRGHFSELWNRMFTRLRKVPGFELNGPIQQRNLSNFNFFIRGLEKSRIAAALKGVAYSSGSACATGHAEASYVLRAIGRTAEEASAAVRFSFGRYTTTNEIDIVTENILNLYKGYK